MMLRMCCTPSLRQEQQPPEFTVFPLTEKVLEKNCVSHQKFDPDNEYNSLMDAVFCSIYPEWKSECFKYYNDEGEKLNETLSRQEIFEYDVEMCVAIEELFEE
jgi:hypothetical protein